MIHFRDSILYIYIYRTCKHSDPSIHVLHPSMIQRHSLCHGHVAKIAPAPQHLQKGSDQGRRPVLEGMPPKSKSNGQASSGSSSSGSSPAHGLEHAESVKDRVGNWAMDDLATTWDNCPLVRERLRDGHQLLMNYDSEKLCAVDGYVDKTVPNLKLNHFVMSPVLKLMSQHDKTLPSLDRLLQQITVLFERSKLNLGSKRGDRIYQEGWAIRRLCGVAKKETYRTSPPKDPMVFKKKITMLGTPVHGFPINALLDMYTQKIYIYI